MRHVLGSLIVLLFGAAAALAVAPAANSASIVGTLHNLSASGPGTFKAPGEQEICIFCHTPHNATSVQPLWNRTLSTAVYKPYTSSSLKAKPGQPTGASKLCLSCHDGTIALGSVASRSQPITTAGGSPTLTGRTNLGTDLTGDHPISFRYDASLVSLNATLKDPASLPKALALDANAELQCTTCHDAHNNSQGYFLTMSNTNSALCVSCHTPSDTDVQSHLDCEGCHQMHNSPSGVHLLNSTTVSDTCLTCHGSTAPPLSRTDWIGWSDKFQLAAVNKAAVGPAIRGLRRQRGANIEPELTKANPHDTRSKGFRPALNGKRGPDEVVCSDCHEPHTIRGQIAPRTATVRPVNVLAGTFGKSKGVSITGAKIDTAKFEYEVCLKCHSDQNPSRQFVSRLKAQPNVRLQFEPSAASFHPVAAKGKNPNVPSLLAPYTTTSLINCTDCHGSETSKKAGGSGPSGPHGSNYFPLLLARYDTQDFSNESAVSYALCYRCHDRLSIVGDKSFPLHKKHVVDQRTPCSACHSAHGVASVQATSMTGAALINFDTLIVQPNPTTLRTDFRHTAPGRGNCTLKCHGKVHTNAAY